MANKNIEPYYLAGYYLVDGFCDWWENKNHEAMDIHTCGCIKHSILGFWCWNMDQEEI